MAEQSSLRDGGLWGAIGGPWGEPTATGGRRDATWEAGEWRAGGLGVEGVLAARVAQGTE